MKINKYQDTDGMRRWELLHEGIQLVLLNEDAPSPYNIELLAFKSLKLLWRLEPQTKTNYDYIVNVWIKNNEVFAGSFSGFEHKINYETGEVFETKFTK